jgi:3-oxoacyl-[acyl-carrier-protein] synthase-3
MVSTLQPLLASSFESFGIELPESRRSTREVVESCQHDIGFDFERLTGIRERRVCAEGEDSYTLAVDAAFECLSRSSHKAEDIELLISCSISKYKGGLTHRFEPALSLSIKEAIGASQAHNFDVSNACAGMLTGVAILDDFIRRGVVRCGMVVSGEYISSISDNATREVAGPTSDQLASLTVGDAGAAVILERSVDGSGIRASEFVTLAEHSTLCIGKPSPGGPGGEMRTDAKMLHDVAIEAGLPVIEQVLARAGIEPGDVDHAIPHQTSRPALLAGMRSYRKKLGRLPKNVVYNLELSGNTASTTHFIALEKAVREGAVEPGESVLLATYASGLVVGAMVFTLGEGVVQRTRAAA